MTNPRRILITGPESSGKTTLCRALATHFDTPWVSEYARSYLDQLDRPYEEADLLHIARGQRTVEEELSTQATNWLFCDTGPLVLRIWLREKFNQVYPALETAWQLHPYAGIILCAPDIPWEADPLRENPDDRDRLMKIYCSELNQASVPVLIVRGAMTERLKAAVAFCLGLRSS